MPQLGLGLRANVSGVSLIDGDASAYFTMAGVTSPTAKAQINAFVKGLKNLGLWNSSVCWLLKSSQNAGTGTTAYSLGGLGTFNGTLTNGPAWGADGISFTSTSQEITLPDNASLYNLRTGFAVYNPNSSSANQKLIEFQEGATAQGLYGALRFDGGAGGERGAKYLITRNSVLSGSAPNTETVSLNSFRSSAFTANDTSDNLFRDGSLVSGGARTGLPAINPTGARGIRQLFGNTSSMVGSFGFLSTATLSNSDIASLNSLYTSTLARNLDLDADAYISRAGVTDPTAQTQINDFVVGIKALGLWSNMVSWPLRSAQNAGTGTTAYSLGGLGTFNGTLAGASLPTWGVNGVNFSPSASSRITAALEILQPFSVYGCISFNLVSVAGSLFSGGAAGNAQMYNFSNVGKIDADAGTPLTSSASYSAGSKFFPTAYFNGASSVVGINNSTNSGSAGSNGISSLVIGNNFNQDYAGKDIEIPFLMFASNSAINSSVYSLYKTTLGTGLGLP